MLAHKVSTMKSNFNFKIHFDDYGEFAHTMTEFANRIQLDHGERDWQTTPIGTDLIQFCERYYPRWYRILRTQWRYR